MRSRIKAVEICFVLLIVFLSFIYNPLDFPLTWVALCLLFYATLDDMFTSSLNILFPILSFIALVCTGFHLHALFLALGVSLVMYIFIWLTKEAYIGEGDAFFALPLIYLAGLSNLFPALLLSAMSGAVGLTVLSLLFGKRPYPFLPYMLFGTMLAVTRWHYDVMVLGGFALLIVCGTILVFRRSPLE
jgi:hypothetical protein